MPTSTPSSNRSARFRTTSEGASARVTWYPSRVLMAALAALTVCACLSMLLSELPRALAWIAIPGLLISGARMILSESRRPRRALVIDAGGTVFLDGQRLDEPRLHWRGPIVRLDWREGRRRRTLLWWPDTLSAGPRRELRLASAALTAPPQTESMAP